MQARLSRSTQVSNEVVVETVSNAEYARWEDLRLFSPRDLNYFSPKYCCFVLMYCIFAFGSTKVCTFVDSLCIFKMYSVSRKGTWFSWGKQMIGAISNAASVKVYYVNNIILWKFHI